MNPFSAQYIRMTKAAEDIQAKKDGRFYAEDAISIKDSVHFVGGEIKADGKGADVQAIPWPPTGERSYWIPRLDQSLEMLGNLRPVPMQALAEIVSKDPVYYNVFSDLHVLALAMAMKEVHGKKWDGLKWVKQ